MRQVLSAAFLVAIRVSPPLPTRVRSSPIKAPCRLPAVLNVGSLALCRYASDRHRPAPVLAELRWFVPTMAKPTTNKAGSGLLGNIPGTLSGLGVPSLGAASDIIGVLTSILFSMYDIYQGMYQNVRVKLEPVIREQCYQRSIGAIKDSQQPIFDVWSVGPDQSTPVPKAKPNHKEKAVDAGTGTAADAYLAKPLSAINDPYDQGLNSIESASNDLAGGVDSWNSFWKDPTPKEGKGKDQLQAIRAAYADPTSCILAAFVSTIRNVAKSVGETTFPLTVVNKILSIIVPACCSMLADIVDQLQDPAFVKGGITQESFDAAGRIYIQQSWQI